MPPRSTRSQQARRDPEDVIAGAAAVADPGGLHPGPGLAHEYVFNCRLGLEQYNLYQEFIENGPRGDIEYTLFNLYAVCTKIWNHPDLVHVDSKPRNTKKKINNGDGDGDDDVDSVGAGMMWAKQMFAAPTTSFQDSPKFLLCYGIVFKACFLGDRTVVFSESHETLNLLERLLQVPTLAGNVSFSFDNHLARPVFCHI